VPDRLADVPSDDALARSLPGEFRSRHADVNGTRLHYVAGGRGEPLFLLPGWPQTWWEFRKIMPVLARRFRVLAVDLRGMGGSAKPDGGFDKKNMAADIRELARALGYDTINIAGHDIGAMVAFSFAANFPEQTRKVAMLDILHPDETSYDMPLLPRPGRGFNTWWWAFNQVRGLPERLLAGRAWYLLDWFFGNFLVDPTATDDRDRAIYARAYDTPDAVRAANGWYQAFHTDIADMATYDKLAMPLLGLASTMTYWQFERQLPQRALDLRLVEIENSSHWLAEEQPERVCDLLVEFFAGPKGCAE
jgi:pimeloyl-ACP methyl ester carboxylesterase